MIIKINMAGIERKQILRRDCPGCRGNGYVTISGGEERTCERCGGAGVLELEVDYKFDTHGKRTREEEAEAWGVDPSEIVDSGHSTGD